MKNMDTIMIHETQSKNHLGVIAEKDSCPLNGKCLTTNVIH